ncbi:jg5023 [Pararge aegeria aegeria]|uniref:Jg5023 protein n=1 Tax=Pararge aegeria aegeria TaxID=348720 RepID=A0A8S4RH99_9NEOP|nr:jg5023 [Pararge aegeria aegeria]
MASTPKQANGKLPSNNNGSGGKRKKSRGSRGSYLSKWLDRTMNHIQESTPSSEMYDTFMSPPARDTNWPGGSQFTPGYDLYKYSMYGSEPLSLPSLSTYYNPIMPMPPPYAEYRFVQNENKGIQVQRPRPRRRSENKAEEVSSTPADAPSMSQTNYLQPKNFTDSQDFTSLPPIVTSMADTNSNSDTQNDKDDVNNARRFSDPCVRGLPDVARPANGDVDSGSESGSGLSGSQVGSRLLACLLDQISTLKIANDRLNKELQEMRAELEVVRQNSYFPKGPNNMGAASNHNGK